MESLKETAAEQRWSNWKEFAYVTRVAFRVGSVRNVESLSLRRCIALARALANNSAEVVFLTADSDETLEAGVHSSGFSTITLTSSKTTPLDAGRGVEPLGLVGVPFSQIADAELTIAAIKNWRPTWIVVDHEKIDSEWHSLVATATGARICVIDRLANRNIGADILIDNTEIEDHRHKFGRRITPSARILGGSRFSLGDDEYAARARYQLSKEVGSIGIVVSEIELPGTVCEVIRGCREMAAFAGEIEMALPKNYASVGAVSKIAMRHGISIVVTDSVELAAFYGRHDLHVCTLMDPSWDRHHVGVPTIAVMTKSCAASKEQLAPSEEAWRAIVDETAEAIGGELTKLIGRIDARRDLAQNARRHLDELGPKRIALALMVDELKLRRAEPSHAWRAFRWRSDEIVRKYSRDPKCFEFQSHVDWWRQTLKDPSRYLLIASCARTDVGVVRLDVIGRCAELSVYLDPNLTGSGLGVSLLIVTQNWVKSNLPVLDEISAFVFPENIFSVAAFQAAGFLRNSHNRWSWSFPHQVPLGVVNRLSGSG